jgi:hypothetical protein
MKTIFRSALAAWTVVIVIAAPVVHAAAEPAVPVSERPAADDVVSTPISSEFRRSIEREAARAAQASLVAPPAAQQRPHRNWAGRHPVLLGLMVGAAGGAAWGAALCHTGCEGGSLTPAITELGAGVGLGIGAGVGAIISLIR